MSSIKILPGQRWISNAESDLGLGTVLTSEGRELRLYFPACGETRTYASDNAPLTRVRFGVDDAISDHLGRRILVTQAREDAGIMVYSGLLEDGSEVQIQEGQLNDRLRIATPRRRLLTGRLDSNRWFELRRETLEQRRLVEGSPVRGLVGAGIDLLHHQLYIAWEVCRRHAPRVLLADEVGLGKTIEAGLILHSLVYNEQVARVLILVPDSLIHQWLVELSRRFHLHFAILDQPRCSAIVDSGQAQNPFQAEQLVLCPLGLFSAHRERAAQLLAADWDLLIVDEAHHLEWSPEAAGDDYRLVEALAQQTKGVLLLTATPEQLGKEGHFARLRLLDPDRFHDLDSFRQEEEQYRPVAEAVDLLLQNEPLSDAALAALRSCLGEDGALPELATLMDPQADPESQSSARTSLVETLLDRHGTGRVLYRNSRANMTGFPERQPIPYPLPLPDEYLESLDAVSQGSAALLTPEALHRQESSIPWQGFDPRMDFLIGLLKRLQGEKLLLICAHRATAVDIAQTLNLRAGIPAAAFHEQLSIIERDRAAAWFADPQDGAQILVCSEIGSEGRNFQFAQHLVLFDLPLNPDLLEQRIGRLDRIGQRHAVKIHIPYLEGSAQQILYRWYEEGLDGFRRSQNLGTTLLAQLRPMLLQALEEVRDERGFELLLKATQSLRQQLEESLRNGRDRLLELHSCRYHTADWLRAEIQSEDDINRSLQLGLPGYLDKLLSTYGVEMEEHSLGSWIFRPGSHMAVDHFPGIPEDGVTCTFHREIALTHEDRRFLTWEHPLVHQGISMLLDDERGTSTSATLRHPDIAPGRLLMEFLFRLECVAPGRLRVGRFLPPSLIHKLFDQDHQELTQLLGEDGLKIRSLDPTVAGRIIQSLEKRINALFDLANDSAAQEIPPLIHSAVRAMEEEYDLEIERLSALASVNPNVRPEEVAALKQERHQLLEYLQGAELTLDSVRLLIST